jgi:FSR family fosmidomycin resistance protein-like MFS transporter
MMLLALFLAASTRSYSLMIVPYILMGLGSGAVHPVGSLHAAEADKQRVATNVAYFFLMGQIGLALGPTLAGLLLDAANVFWLSPYLQAPGVEALAFPTGNVAPLFGLALLAVLPVTLMATRIPQRHKAKLQTGGFDWRALPLLPLLALAVMVIFRGLAQPGSVNFIPSLFQQKGWSPSEYGLITSSFWIAAGLAGVFMGTLADRYDQRKIVMWTMLASAPAFFLLPHLDGPLAFLAAVLAGGLSGGTHSMLVVLAQELIPGGKAFASGAMLGFIFGTGALGSLVIGGLADAIGLANTFHGVALAAAISGVLALALPRRA